MSGLELLAHLPSRTPVIAATHRPLRGMVEEGSFREDLLYRLQCLEIEVPPLRERRSDNPLLVWHIVARTARDAGLTPPVLPHRSSTSSRAGKGPGTSTSPKSC